MMHYYDWGLGWGNYWFMWLFHIAIIVLSFVVVWWVIKSSNTFGYKVSEADSAADILKKRLAKGEISLKEYEKLKNEIEKD